MTLGIGSHVAKLASHYDQETKQQVIDEPAAVVQGEAYHEFEIVDLVGNQGDPQGFVAKLKLVK